jgi:hypothetical protein
MGGLGMSWVQGRSQATISDELDHDWAVMKAAANKVGK